MTKNLAAGTIGRRGLLISGVSLMATTGCGYLLYPGRRGRSGGQVDLLVLVVDLLWLIPGLLPGLICLVVDFTTGCIYGGGGGGGRASGPQPTRDAGQAVVEVELDGEVVATGQTQGNGQTHLAWSRAIDEASLRERAHLVVRTVGGAQARAPLATLLQASAAT